LAQQAGAMAFVTTEKDVVNLGRLDERVHPLHVVKVRMAFEPLVGGESPIEVVCAVLQRRAEMTVRE
jgi:tetraacyldisaccharide-1-P 4'-kinase